MTLDANHLKTDESTVAVISPWPLRAIGLLLLVEAFALVGISSYLAAKIDWVRELESIMPTDAMIEIVLWLLGAAPLALLLLFTAIGFFFRWRMAWLLAMSSQGFLLLGCLTFYFFTQSGLRTSGLVHLLMVYAVLMVLYQNTMDVRIAFHPLEEEETEHRLEGDEARFRQSEFGASQIDTQTIDGNFTPRINQFAVDEQAADEPRR